MTHDYLKYYDLETYLFEDVRQRFHKEGKLGAFDLFSIVIWKSNRSKSRLVRRLAKKAGSLERAATQCTSALFKAESAEARLLLAMKDWGFYLPMASSILSVLWPEEFTVFDVRVCEELVRDKLGDFRTVGNLIPEHVWPEYCRYREAVDRAVPELAFRRQFPADLGKLRRHLYSTLVFAPAQGIISMAHDR
jgi:hypothetical protein